MKCCLSGQNAINRASLARVCVARETDRDIQPELEHVPMDVIIDWKIEHVPFDAQVQALPDYLPLGSPSRNLSDLKI